MSDFQSFHSVSIEETFKIFQTTHEGLTQHEAAIRLKKYGKNLINEEKNSYWRIFFRQFQNILVVILFVASLISLLMGEWGDFFVINTIIILNGLTGFWQEIKAEVSISALKKMTESRNQVYREGCLKSIPSSDLVPGDYVVFHEGSVVTADVRLTDSHGLMIDEAAMTGESIPINKDHLVQLNEEALPFERLNMALAGTTVVRGIGYGVVTKTGHSTYLASIAEKAAEESPETPLGKALRFFSKRYLILLLVVFSSLGIAGLFQGRSALDLGYILLAGLVSAVPAGLPLVVTLVMVIGALALSRKKTLIRYLPSVETLGSVTVIASDKTGTITEGKLVVRDVFTDDLNGLKQVAALCNDAKSEAGDPLDIALLKWVENGEVIQRQNKRIWSHSFDTNLRLMATAYEVAGEKRLLIKGAFESLKEKVHVKSSLERWENANHQFLNEGLRVIAFGSGKWEENPDHQSWKIELIGLIGFLDPPKEGVKEAVESAKKAGVHVIMITGDHPLTAQSIAKEVGIYREGDQILTGQEVESMEDHKLLNRLEKVTVLARILPEHKYRVVKILQQHHQLIAVTGDGVNDIPALKAADIGIAMGSGTEAAKAVSKMIIMDNNLKVIVEAIQNARVIADNIRKVIYYLVSTSLQEVTLLALAIFTGLPLPLVAIQILWVNIVTDGVLDKTFPFALAEDDVMIRKPVKPEKRFFDRGQLFNIGFFGLVVGGLIFGLYAFLRGSLQPELVSTIIFNSVVFVQWANGIQAQKENEPFFKNIKKSILINPYIYLGLGLGIVLQFSIINFVPQAFHSVSIDLKHWVYPGITFLAAFLLVELRKWGRLLFFRRSNLNI